MSGMSLIVVYYTSTDFYLYSYGVIIVVLTPYKVDIDLPHLEADPIKIMLRASYSGLL